MTDELKDLKPGDLITAYISGYHRVVRVEDRFVTKYDLRFDSCKGKSVGDYMSPMVHYVTVMSAKFKPVKGKTEHYCDLYYCRKVTLSGVRLEFQQKTQELTGGYGRLIQFLQEEGSR